MSAHIQRHFVRLYTRKGYQLLAGNPSDGFARQDLDVTSENVPVSYLKAQRRLDFVLQSRRLPWSLCLLWDSPQRKPIVAYGALVELPNERGDLHGVFFVHAVEAQGSASLVSLVEGVVRQLSPAGLQKLLEGIEKVAASGRAGESFAVEVSRWLEENCPAGAPPLSVPAAEGINCIFHDRAGSAPVAWLAMAAAHARMSPPWEVSDVASHDDQIGTRSLEHDKLRSGEAVTVSNLLSRAAEPREKVFQENRPPVRDALVEGSNSPQPLPPIPQDSNPKPVQTEPAEPAPSARRRYLVGAMAGIILFLGVRYSMDRSKQTNHQEPPAGLARLVESQNQAETRLAALEESLTELKEWRARTEGRALIQRVLAREAGALKEAKHLWEKDPEWLRLLLQEIRQNKHHKFATLDVVRALQETDVDLLKRSQKEIADFLDDVGGNGPQTEREAQAIRDRLGLP